MISKLQRFSELMHALASMNSLLQNGQIATSAFYKVVWQHY